MKGNADHAAFGKSMAVMAEVFQVPLSTLLIEGYWHSLKRFDLGQVVQAIEDGTAQPGRFAMPKPGELIELIEKPVKDRAILALVRVERACYLYGSWQSVDFEDPVLHQTVRMMGGWPAVCEWNNLHPREYEIRRRELQRLFEVVGAMRESERDPKAAGHLPGRTELDGGATKVLVLGPDGRLASVRQIKALTPAKPMPAVPDTAPKALKELLGRYATRR